MKVSTLILGAVAAIGLNGTALAADLFVQQPAPYIAPSAAYDWTGFYVGVHGGYGAGVMNLSADFISDDDQAQDVDGFFGGIQLGYNVQLDSILLGVQTDLSLSGISSNEDGGGDDDTVDWLGSTTARIGFVADSFVPYLKAGFAYGGGTGDAAGEKDSQTHIGWTAGAGVEFAVTDAISVFAEYNYYSLGAETYEFDPGPVEADINLHTVKAGLNFAF